LINEPDRVDEPTGSSVRFMLRARRPAWVLSLVVLVMIATACGGPITGRPAAPAPDKSGVPVGHYDVAIFLCLDANQFNSCPGPSTPDEIANLRRQLLGDPRAVEILYLSERDSYLVDRAELKASLRQYVHVGTLPAVFLVYLSADGRNSAAFTADYASVPGVDVANSCRTRLLCSVTSLRKLGIVH